MPLFFSLTSRSRNQIALLFCFSLNKQNKKATLRDPNIGTENLRQNLLRRVLQTFSDFWHFVFHSGTYSISEHKK